MLPLQVRLDMGVKAIKGYSTFPKAPELEPHDQIVLCHILDTHLGGGVDPFVEILLAYSTVPADWAMIM